MKKIIISLFAIIALLFTGCFIDSDTATVKINLGNLPVAKVDKKSFIDRFLLFFAKEAMAQEIPGNIIVHLGAFDSNNQLLAKKSISNDNYPTNNIVEFDVPARSGVTIVVLGEYHVEGEVGYISYYGKNENLLYLTVGKNEEVIIEMWPLTESYINLPYDSQLIAKWDRVTGASLYKIYTTDNELIHSTGFNYFESVSPTECFLRIEFEFVGKDSGDIYFRLNQV